MNFYTSYFYRLRYFEPYEIPLSTAVWDPKWYHDFKGQDNVFVDKRGVINGARAEFFVPDDSCSGLCHGPSECQSNPCACAFLHNYRKQLDALDFNWVMETCEECAHNVWSTLRLSRMPDIIFLFHEVPDNPCSERRVVIEWFAANNASISEWEPRN